MSARDQDFDRNARSLLMRRIFEGSPTGVNYAPDSRYDPETRCNVDGPLTLQIAEILRRHAQLWALEQRTRVNPTESGGRAEWFEHMRQADAEISRFVASHKLTSGAAA